MGAAGWSDRGGEIEAAVRKFKADTAKAARGGAGGAVRVSFNDDDKASTRGFDRVFVGLAVTLEGMVSVLSDPNVVQVIRAQFARNFDEERGRRKWAQLAPSTVLERQRLGFGGRHPILERTGKLRAHVMTTPVQTSRTPQGARLRIAPSPDVGGVPKYRALAKGHGRLPARPMVVIDSQGATKVTSAISRALRTRAAANGIR